MFEYRGRKLDINDEYMLEYKAYTGEGLIEKFADLCIYMTYIRDKNKVDTLGDVVKELSDRELVDIIEDVMSNEK